MRIFLAGIALATLVLAAASAPVQALTATADQCTEKSVALIDAWERGDDATAAGLMNPLMRMMEVDHGLKPIRDDLQEKFGGYRSRGTAELTPDGRQYITVRIPLKYTRGTPVAIINCDLDDRDIIASFAVP